MRVQMFACSKTLFYIQDIKIARPIANKSTIMECLNCLELTIEMQSNLYLLKTVDKPSDGTKNCSTNHSNGFCLCCGCCRCSSSKRSLLASLQWKWVNLSLNYLSKNKKTQRKNAKIREKQISRRQKKKKRRTWSSRKTTHCTLEGIESRRVSNSVNFTGFPKSVIFGGFDATPANCLIR